MNGAGRLGRGEKHTRRPLLLDHPLEQEIEDFTAELPGAHEYYLNLARGPYERCVDYAESLGDEGEPGAEVRYWVVRVLQTVNIFRTWGGG